MEEVYAHQEASSDSTVMRIDRTSMADVPGSTNQQDHHEANSLPSIGKTRVRRFAGFRFGFRGKKNKASPEDAVDNPKLKKARQEKKNKLQKPEKSLVPVVKSDKSTQINNVAPSLSEADEPVPFKRTKSKSKLVGTLVRKLSFGTRNVKKPTIVKKSLIDEEVISNEDLNSNSSLPASPANSPELEGNDGPSSYYSSGEYVTLSSAGSTHYCTQMERDEGGVNFMKTEVSPQMQGDIVTSTPLHRDNQLYMKLSAKIAKSDFLIPDEIILLAEPKGDQSVVSTMRRQHPLGQSDVAAMTRVNPVAEPSPQTSITCREETSSRSDQSDVVDVAVAVIRTASLPEAFDVLPCVAGKSTTFALQAEKPVGLMSDSGGAVVPPSAVHIGNASPLSGGSNTGDSAQPQTKSIASETYRLRTAWITAHDMNTGKVDEDSLPEVEDVAAKPSKLSTKEQILSITTPIWERQQMEVDSKRTEANGPPEETTSVMSHDDSVAGSSKLEVYGTPCDSPTPRTESEVDTDSLSPEVVFSTPREEVTFYTSEESYSPEEKEKESDVGKQKTGEDLMALARARLSQNLGISSAVATQIGEKREHLYKILVIGELGTGKTSIIKRYVHQFFSQHYRATIGVDFALKVLNWDTNTIIRLQLWDIAGQERFGNMTRVYYKEAVGAFIVFDVARAATFDAVVKWKQDLDSKVQLPDGSPIPCVLLANKCDQQKEGLVNHPAKMDEYCKDKGFVGWFETSAKENINIEEAARLLVTKILQNDQLRTHSESSRDGDKFNLDSAPGHADRAKSKCAC